MKERILEKLSPEYPWADRVFWFPEIGSTNTEAKKLAQNGAPQGTALIADAQTGGRGRMGRSFHSAPGVGVYLSVILRPECKPEQLMHLTCAVAVAMCRALQKATGYCPGIKWINDLIAEGKKLGGILTELSLNPATGLVDFAIVGIGINCNQELADFPEDIRDIATSLRAVLGHSVDRSLLIAAMLEALREMADTLLTDKNGLMAAYKASCITLGQDVYLLRGESRYPCRALDLDADGSLLVEYPDGKQEFVCSGEVSVRNF